MRFNEFARQGLPSIPVVLKKDLTKLNPAVVKATQMAAKAAQDKLAVKDPTTMANKNVGGIPAKIDPPAPGTNVSSAQPNALQAQPNKTQQITPLPAQGSQMVLPAITGDSPEGKPTGFKFTKSVGNFAELEPTNQKPGQIKSKFQVPKKDLEKALFTFKDQGK